jgi:hypothetical protein
MNTTSSPPQPGGLYLVERYLAASAARQLPAVVARLAGFCSDSAGGVAYLHSTLLPTEDTCFCLFRASSGDAVRAVNADAGFRVDRLTDAVLMFDGVTRP